MVTILLCGFPAGSAIASGDPAVVYLFGVTALLYVVAALPILLVRPSSVALGILIFYAVVSYLIWAWAWESTSESYVFDGFIMAAFPILTVIATFIFRNRRRKE